MYNYSDDTYSFTNTAASLSTVVGFLALLMLVLGCLVPAGKVIILEALVVVQIVFFSLLQFDKLPLTFLGLKNLALSNGYNDGSLF